MTIIASGLPIWARPWFPFLQLAWVAAAGALWYLFPQLGPWPLCLGLLPWLARLLTTRHAGQRTPFDIPLLVFLLTAGLSLWAAYDPDGSRAVFPMPVGRRKLWGLMLAVLVFYSATEFKTERQRWWLLVALAGFGTAVALWFTATNDWDATVAIWDGIARLGTAIQSRLPYVPGHRLSPNVAGGLIALVLPAGLELATRALASLELANRCPAAGLTQTRAGGQTPARQLSNRATKLGALWGILALAVMALGLFLSSSRGAWLGAAGALSLAAAWWLAGRLTLVGSAPDRLPATRRQADRRSAVFVALVAAAALVGTLAIVGLPSLRSMILESQALANRLTIFYQASHLVRDYLFTGIGLGNFPFVHSTYVLLIHVPATVFAHCTPIDVAVEQGIVGAVAMAVVWIGAGLIGMRRLAEPGLPPAALPTALLSLAVLIIHGAFDSTIYGSRALLLLWMPAGLALAASYSPSSVPGGVENRTRLAPESSAKEPGLPEDPPRGGGFAGTRVRLATILVAVVLFLALLAVVWRPLAAAWYANLGAVHQTLVELRAYDHRHFDDPTLDEVRRRENLSQAERDFQRALALDPGQVTARTRLAQIALARGDYAAALEHALAAWSAGYQDRVTRLVLSDALVADGRPDEAAALVKGLEFAKERLQGQAYARYQRNGDLQRAAYALRAALALDPQDAQTRQALIRAEEGAAQQ